MAHVETFNQDSKYLTCITKIIGIYGKKIFSLEISKFSLALQPLAFVNTSGQVLFSSPVNAFGKLHKNNNFNQDIRNLSI